jgi:hypothetical protein
MSVYQDLQPTLRQIRLLTIQPGQDDSSVSCALTTHSLYGKPSYETLSYVWGNPAEKRSINVNGVRFLVTVNLEAALRELRIHRPRALWVDAICINQEDPSERSSQVRLMSTIYKTATHTAVWLGEETDQSRCAFQLLHSLESLDSLKQWSMLPPSTPTSVIEENLIKFDSHLNSMPNAAAGLRDFWNDVMRRPWWTRAWIVQEIVLSSNATLICGRSSISWKSFQILFNFLSSSAVRVVLTNPLEDVRSGVSAMI